MHCPGPAVRGAGSTGQELAQARVSVKLPRDSETSWAESLYVLLFLFCLSLLTFRRMTGTQASQAHG